MSLKDTMASLMAAHLRKLTARRAWIILAIQDGKAASNSEFARALRTTSASVAADLKWLCKARLIYARDAAVLGDQRRQRYALTRLGYSAVASIAMTQ